MNESKDSIELQDKIAYLKGARIIKTLQDVANKTDYSKGTVSAYVSGKTRPSKDFLTKFEDSYPELKNFVMGGQLTYQQKRHENKLNGNREDVPVYNGSTTLGHTTEATTRAYVLPLANDGISKKVSEFYSKIKK